MKDYKNFYYHEENGMPVFCYRTGFTVYEEIFSCGRLMSGGFNASGYTQNLLGSNSIRVPAHSSVDSSVFSVDVDGASVCFDTEYLGYEEKKLTEENGSEYILIKVYLRALDGSVNINVCTRLDGTGVILRYIELENVSGRSVSVGNIVPFGGVIDSIVGWDQYVKNNDPKKIYSLGSFGSSNWCCEGLFGWNELPSGGTSIFGRYEAGRFRHPAFFLRNNALGGIFACQLAYSGGYEFALNNFSDCSAGGFESGVQNSILGLKVKLAGPNPQYILSAGETLTTPTVHITKIFGDLDDAVNEMNRHIRRSVLTLPDPHGIKGVLASGMGPEHPMTVEGTKFFIDTAARVGAEMFIIDAGWYCPPGKQGSEWNARAGDWYPDPDRYPNGISEIVDYAHEKGLMFGIWMDPERLGRLSVAASEHPDWLCPAYTDNKPGSIINMANPEAAAWVEEQIARVLTETKADLFRLDYNIGPREIFVKDEKDGRKYCNTVAYCNAVYKMYRSLRLRFPNVFFENCAGGGGRTDLGMMRNFNHTWVSDWQIAPRSFAITNGMTMALPPECVDRLASGMTSHTKGSLDFQLRQTLFGKPTTNSYNAVGSEFNELQLDFVKHCYDIYKDFIRPYAASSMMYHHTPECFGVHPDGVGVIERASEDGERSVIGVFKLANSAECEEITVRPRGILPSGWYKVILDNAAISDPDFEAPIVGGYDITQNGIRVRLASALTSELIILEKV